MQPRQGSRRDESPPATERILVEEHGRLQAQIDGLVAELREWLKTVEPNAQP